MIKVADDFAPVANARHVADDFAPAMPQFVEELPGSAAPIRRHDTWHSLNKHEAPPKPSAEPASWDLVKADINERDALGAAKYGVRLQPFNGRNVLVDLYQELLDATVYCRTVLHEHSETLVAHARLRTALKLPPDAPLAAIVHAVVELSLQ